MAGYFRAGIAKMAVKAGIPKSMHALRYSVDRFLGRNRSNM